MRIFLDVKWNAWKNFQKMQIFCKQPADNKLKKELENWNMYLKKLHRFKPLPHKEMKIRKEWRDMEDRMKMYNVHLVL